MDGKIDSLLLDSEISQNRHPKIWNSVEDDPLKNDQLRDKQISVNSEKDDEDDEDDKIRISKMINSGTDDQNNQDNRDYPPLKDDQLKDQITTNPMLDPTPICLEICY